MNYVTTNFGSIISFNSVQKSSITRSRSHQIVLESGLDLINVKLLYKIKIFIVESIFIS